MQLYDIYEGSEIAFRNVSLERAAEITNLDPFEILWAIEEHGACANDADLVIVSAGDDISFDAYMAEAL